nr:TraR/DksA C4-type zinc finger protein [Roseospira navarrensis]
MTRPAAEGADACQVCGEEIDAARRAACPGAVRCADCQNDHERRRDRRLRTGV